jgi:small GTP-binding protein
MTAPDVELPDWDHMSEISNEEVEVRDIFKLVFLGDSGVGKTNLMSRFTSDVFNINSKPTIGVDFGIKTVAIAGHIIKLQLWDTAGHERYKTFTAAYFKDSLGLIVVYDITRIESFRNVEKWLEIANEHLSYKDVKLLLIGNKLDLDAERQVSQLEADDFAKKHNMIFMEVSALDNRNDLVGSAFFKLIRGLITRHCPRVRIPKRRGRAPGRAEVQCEPHDHSGRDIGTQGHSDADERSGNAAEVRLLLGSRGTLTYHILAEITWGLLLLMSLGLDLEGRAL